MALPKTDDGASTLERETRKEFSSRPKPLPNQTNFLDGLTARQREIVDFIRQFQADHGYPPTVREIARALHFTLSATGYHIDRIEAAGAIVRSRGSRNIRIVGETFPSPPPLPPFNALALSACQRRCYDAILDHIEKNNRVPTILELCTALGIKGPWAVHRHLKSLEQKGAIYRQFKSSRAIRVAPIATESTN